MQFKIQKPLIIILGLVCSFSGSYQANAKNSCPAEMSSELESAISKTLSNHPKLRKIVLTYLRDPQGDPDIKSLFKNQLISEDLQLNLFDNRSEINDKYGFSFDLYSFVKYNFNFSEHGFDTFDEKSLNSRLDESVERLRADKPELFRRKFIIFVGDEDSADENSIALSFAFLHLTHELAHMRFIEILSKKFRNLEGRFPETVFVNDNGFYRLHGNLFTFLTERYAWLIEAKALQSLLKPYDETLLTGFSLRSPVRDEYQGAILVIPAHLSDFFTLLFRGAWDLVEQPLSHHVARIYDVDLYARFNTEEFHKIPLATMLGTSITEPAKECEDIVP